MTTERSLINTHRSAWRSISSEMRAVDPNIVSQVQVHENGVIAAVFFRNDEFQVEGVGDLRTFRKLTHAEDFAVEQLIRQERTE